MNLGLFIVIYFSTDIHITFLLSKTRSGSEPLLTISKHSVGSRSFVCCFVSTHPTMQVSTRKPCDVGLGTEAHIFIHHINPTMYPHVSTIKPCLPPYFPLSLGAPAHRAPALPGCLATPNCVGFMDFTSPVVGEAATEQAANNLANTVFAPQRLLGATWMRPFFKGGSSCGGTKTEHSFGSNGCFPNEVLFWESIHCFGGSCESTV